MDKLEAALEASPEAVLVVDTNGMIRIANRNVPEVLGYTPAELEGEPVETLLLEEDHPNHVQYRERYMENPEPRPMGRDLELYALHKDGTEVPVEISLGPIELENQELLVVATIGELTTVKRRELELQRQNERLEKFTSIVSHDLRNPLNVAVTRLELAKEEADTEHLDHIDGALTRMSTLIEDLLTLAREGNAATTTEPVDLALLAETSWDLVASSQAKLTVETDGSILGDQSRVQQLFENLFRNAIEHGGDSVTVTVGEMEDGFYVADTGPGIPDERRTEVFEAGFSTGEGGNGFGLSIVKEIVDAHGWGIRATEAATGGARFEITGVEYVR